MTKTQASETKEEQYQECVDFIRQHGHEKMGMMSSHAWYHDPKRLTFTLARYKFVAKMFSGFKNVLEVGCADAFATRLVAQEVENITAIDFDPIFIEDVHLRMSNKWHFNSFVHDMLSGPPPGKYQGIYSMDVLEHINPSQEDVFMANLTRALEENGAVIIGMPSLESQQYASEISKLGHVNCKTMPDFKKKMHEYFHHVFMFSMNDEVVHTGFHKMAHYLLALCTSKK